MQKIKFYILPVLLIVIIFSGKNQEEVKYKDLIQTLNLISKKSHKSIMQIEKAKNSKRIYKLLKRYADDMEYLIPHLYKLEEKYPELDFGIQNTELKKAFDNFEKLITQKKVLNIKKKISEYADQDDRIKSELDRIKKIFLQ